MKSIEKKRDAMKSKFSLHLISVILLVLIASGCSQTLVDRQIRFGAQAAKENLWDEAIFRWKKVIAENPRSVAAHNNLAIAYEKKGLWEEAKKEYETALQINPNDKFLSYNYTQFLKRAEKQEKRKNEKN
jgi:Tfp pilus assembly protein PilF